MPPISYTPDYMHITYPNSPMKRQGVDISFCFIVSILAAIPTSYIADLAHQASPASLKTMPFCGCEACSRPASLKTMPFCGCEACSRPAGLKTTPFCGCEACSRPASLKTTPFCGWERQKSPSPPHRLYIVK